MSSPAPVAVPPSAPRKRARGKILEAAQELARVAGPGNLSLDAVAARAGVSKGGLLYHFPTKAKLLAALVEEFLESLDRSIRERERLSGGGPDGLVRAYLDVFVGEHLCHEPPPSGLLAALGEDPGFLAPVRCFDRMLLDRLKANAGDPTVALIVFLTLHGMKSMQLLNIECVSEAEFDSVVSRLRAMLAPASSGEVAGRDPSPGPARGRADAGRRAATRGSARSRYSGPANG